MIYQFILIPLIYYLVYEVKSRVISIKLIFVFILDYLL